MTYTLVKWFKRRLTSHKLVLPQRNTREKRKRKMGSLSYESKSRDYGNSYEYPEEFEGREFSGESLFDNTTSNRDPWPKNKIQKKKQKNQVFLEGYVETSDEDELGRTKSLTDEDLDELKGCLDLGFGFSYDEIPELCNTLPALELCYSMSQKFLDEQQKSPDNSDQIYSASPMAVSDTCSPPSGPIANWKISSPGDHPEDVKARLKFWAQAVACTVRLCN